MTRTRVELLADVDRNVITLEKRLREPDETLPAIDDRNAEHPADVFIRLADNEPQRRLLLNAAEVAIAKPQPDLAVVKGIAYLAGRVIPEVHPRLFHWLTVQQPGERRLDTVAMSVIDTLVKLQPRDAPAYVEQWKRLWERAPTWTPAVFKALAERSPAAAVPLIPELIERAAGQRLSAGRLIASVALDPTGVRALVDWLRGESPDLRSKVLSAVEGDAPPRVVDQLKTAGRAPLFGKPPRLLEVDLESFSK